MLEYVRVLLHKSILLKLNPCYIAFHKQQVIGLNINSDKTEILCFKQNSAVYTLNGEHLKLVNQLAYLSRFISSTENIRIKKVLSDINRPLIKNKSDIFVKIK